MRAEREMVGCAGAAAAAAVLGFLRGVASQGTDDHSTAQVRWLLTAALLRSASFLLASSSQLVL